MVYGLGLSHILGPFGPQWSGSTRRKWTAAQHSWLSWLHSWTQSEKRGSSWTWRTVGCRRESSVTMASILGWVQSLGCFGIPVFYENHISYNIYIYIHIVARSLYIYIYLFIYLFILLLLLYIHIYIYVCVCTMMPILHVFVIFSRKPLYSPVSSNMAGSEILKLNWQFTRKIFQIWNMFHRHVWLPVGI